MKYLFSTLLIACVSVLMSAQPKLNLNTGSIDFEWQQEEDGWHISCIKIDGKQIPAPKGYYTVLYIDRNPAKDLVDQDLEGKDFTFYPSKAEMLPDGTLKFSHSLRFGDVEAIWKVDPLFPSDIKVDMKVRLSTNGSVSIATPTNDHPAPLSEILKALLDSIWAILFPVLLIVLIRFGIMSPTESGSFACAYALLVGTVFYHELTWESLLQTLRDSVKDITVITIILAFSGVFGYGIVFDNITVTIANALLGITSNSAILLLLVVVFLLICGMFMETTVIALILTPILLPVMRSIGVNEVVFGMIMMTTVTFGVMTPPVGTALYAVSDIMECPIEETFKKGWPFYLAIVGVILFMIFFPQAVLFLPNLVYGA